MRLLERGTGGSFSTSAALIMPVLALAGALAIPRPAAAQEDAGVPDEADPDAGLSDDVDEPSDAGPEPHAEPEAIAEPAKETPAACPPVEECPDVPRQPPPDVTFRGSETLIVEFVGDNGDNNEYLHGDDDNFWVFRNSLYLQASSRPFDGGIRLDGMLFHNPPSAVDPDTFAWGPGANGYTLLNYHHDYRVERFHATVKSGGLRVTGGDFYVTFGRGMVLSLIKADDIALDNALRGGRIEYDIPRRFRIVLVGGVVNALNYDQFTHQVLEDDPLDRIAGLRAEWDAMDELTLGVHVVGMIPRYDKESEVNPHRNYVDRGTGIRALSGGASADIHAGDLNLYVEGNGQVHDNYRPPAEVPDVTSEAGYAAMTEATYMFPKVSVSLQGFYYRKWLMEGPLRGSSTNIVTAAPLSYNFRVAVEPTWVPAKSIGNSWGGKLAGDLFLLDGKTQITLASAFLKYEGGLLPQGQWLQIDDTIRIHPTLGLRQEIGDSGIRAKAEGGYLHEMEVAGGDRYGLLWHAMLDLMFPITGPHSISAKDELRRHELEISEGGEPYWVNQAKLGYDHAGLLGIHGMYEYSDQTVGIDAKLGDWSLPLPRRHYLIAEIVFHAPKPLDGLTLTLSGGSQRGGKKCTPGGCLEFPDAVGVKLETVYRF
jgi:hypothetical protein